MNDARLFFIVGTGRCGSTLLQSIFNAHTNLHIPAETHFFFELDPVRLGFGDPLGDDAEAEAYCRRAGGTAWWARLGLPDGALREIVLDRGVRGSAGIFSALLAQLTPPERRNRRLGEKSPHHEKQVGRIATLFPHSRFIHIVRDPRDVAESMLRMPWWPHRDVVASAWNWRRVMARASGFSRSLGTERYAFVRFEELVTKPRAELERLCAFLDEPFDERMLDHASHTERAFLEIETPYKSGAVRSMDPSHIGKHRGRLSENDIRAVEFTAGPWLRRMGYAISTNAGGSLAQRLRAAGRAYSWKYRRRSA